MNRYGNATVVAVTAVSLWTAAWAQGQPYDYTWLAANGATWWGGSVDLGGGYYGNGWGNSWYYTNPNPQALYPGLGESVLIPAGMYVSSGSASWGDQAAYCGSLTIEAGAQVDRGWSTFYSNGPFIENNGLDMIFGKQVGLYGDLELRGAGDYRMDVSTYQSATLVGLNDYRTLTVGSDVMIYGQGRIGQDSPGWYGEFPLNIINHGVIRATPSGVSVRLDIYATGASLITNHGLIEAADMDIANNPAVLNLLGNVDNTNGTIRAGNGSQVWLSGWGGAGGVDGHITGGVLSTAGTGVIKAIGGPSMVIEDVRLEGYLLVPTYESTAIRTAMDVATGGLFQLGADGISFGTGTAYLKSNVQLGGTGRTLLGLSSSIQGSPDLAGAPTLTIAAGHTVEMREGSALGEGNGGVRSPVIVNRGTIHYNPAITGATEYARLWGHHGITNEGRIYVDHSAEAEQGLWVFHQFTQTAGELICDGYLRFYDCGAVNITGGTVGGIGTINCYYSWLELGPDVTLAPGSSPGTLTMQADVQLADGIDYVVEVGDSAADLIIVAGTLTFDGHVNIILRGSDLSAQRTLDLTLFQFNALAGTPTFDISAPDGWTWGQVVQVGNTLVLNEVTAAIPEPDVALLACVGWSALALRRRRR